MHQPSGRRPGRPRKIIPEIIAKEQPIMSSTETVSVACKVPNGLILRVGAFETITVPVLGGGLRDEKIWRATADQIKINGPKRAMESGDPDSPVADGYALTFGVNADLMAKWMADNADSDIVRNHLIVVNTKREDLKAMTKEGRTARTGLEPMAQGKDPRLPRFDNVEKMVA